MRYQELRVMAFESIGSSRWLKQALVELEGRDVLDALSDIETLGRILMVKWEELSGKSGNEY